MVDPGGVGVGEVASGVLGGDESRAPTWSLMTPAARLRAAVAPW
jgi:hypothetical protein